MLSRRKCLTARALAVVAFAAIVAGTTRQAPSALSQCHHGSFSAQDSQVVSSEVIMEFPEDGCDPVRFHQARYLIEGFRGFLSRARPLHEKIEEQILIARTLKGEANMLINKMPQITPPKLQGKALEAAVQEHARDLKTFYNNVEKYRADLNSFRATIGECHQADAEYARQRKLYDLHCDQFHVRA